MTKIFKYIFDNPLIMKHNNLEILIILFQLLAIESEVYFQFLFLKFSWLWKNLLLQNQVGVGDLGPLSTLGPIKNIKIRIKEMRQKSKTIKIEKIIQTPNSSWESIEIPKDFIIE